MNRRQLLIGAPAVIAAGVATPSSASLRTAVENVAYEKALRSEDLYDATIFFNQDGSSDIVVPQDTVNAVIRDPAVQHRMIKAIIDGLGSADPHKIALLEYHVSRFFGRQRDADSTHHGIWYVIVPSLDEVAKTWLEYQVASDDSFEREKAAVKEAVERIKAGLSDVEAEVCKGRWRHLLQSELRASA
jgi:hypothetical protein